MAIRDRLTSGLAVAAVSLAMAGAAQASSSLSGSLTSDNQFAAYLSTSDNTLGTLLGSGSDWTQAYSLNSASLASGQTYYLHIIADNQYGPGSGSNPDSLLGDLSLAGTGHVFSNGQTTLSTNTVNWSAEAAPVQFGTSWSAAPSGTPVDLGVNGSAIWGTALGRPVSGISTNAHWIWSNTDPSGEALFSTTISAVPEPASWALMILGLAMVGTVLRRRPQAVTA